jgi:hypothetical protein
MKHLTSILFILINFFSFSQDITGFTIISNKNYYVPEADNISLSDGKNEEKSNEKNIFSFSFNDSVFIHTPINKDDVISQVYKITSVFSKQEQNGVYMYLINIQSGLSGNYYTYYVVFNGSDLRFTQLYDISDESEEKLTCSGVRFEKLTHTLIRPYEKL